MSMGRSFRYDASWLGRLHIPGGRVVFGAWHRWKRCSRGDHEWYGGAGPGTYSSCWWCDAKDAWGVGHQEGNYFAGKKEDWPRCRQWKDTLPPIEPLEMQNRDPSLEFAAIVVTGAILGVCFILLCMVLRHQWSHNDERDGSHAARGLSRLLSPARGS